MTLGCGKAVRRPMMAPWSARCLLLVAAVVHSTHAWMTAGPAMTFVFPPHMQLCTQPCLHCISNHPASVIPAC